MSASTPEDKPAGFGGSSTERGTRRTPKEHWAVTALRLARLLSHLRHFPSQALALQLGVSEEELSAGIRRLKTMGVVIEDVPGLGFGLVEPLDWLDAILLRGELVLAAPSLSPEVLDACGSTNRVLAARAATASMGTVVACELQHAGRGRRGRSWISGLASGLSFSLLWRFALRPADLSGLSLAVAVILVRALERQGFTDLTLKWPNDLLHRGRKFGGILLELVEAAHPNSGATAVVVGVGLNLRLPAALADRIDRPATALDAAAGGHQLMPDRTRLLVQVLGALAADLPVFEAQGFAPFREEWLRRHAHQGRRVSLRLDDRLLVEGEAVGVADDGALLIRSAQGTQRVLSGEVSLR